jgi:dTDP-4-dehydrorhamnose 3,5-epimerase
MKKQDRNKIKDIQGIKKTSIAGLLIIERPTHKDERGFFREAVRLNELEEISGLRFDTKQWNHSFSLPKTIRALHAEGWNKLVYPVTGKMFAAIVDIRPDSKTFGKIETFTFDETKPRALFIPKGLANSICVVGTKPVHYFYLVDKYYDGSDTTAIAWDDPDLNIDWPVKDPIISERDKNNSTLREAFPEKFNKK